jgi:hypothetical protein
MKPPAAIPAMEPRPDPALDWLGIALSTACVAHCLLVPAAVIAAPVLGAAWIGSGIVSLGFIGLAGGVALPAVVRGHRVHRSWRPAVLGALGLAAMIVAEGLLEGRGRSGAGVTIAGGMLLVAAHLDNIRGAGRCPVSQPNQPEGERAKALTSG